MKKILSLLSLLILSVFITSSSLFAEIRLPAIFGDNMVLQQKTDAAIWGKAADGANVRISTSWNNKTYSVKAGIDGSWRTKVATPEAGGPYRITVSDGKAVTLNNVMRRSLGLLRTVKHGNAYERLYEPAGARLK